MPVVTVLLTEATKQLVFSAETASRLAGLAEVRYAEGPASSWDLAALLDGAVACVTGWGTPRLEQDVLDVSPSLRLIAHTAGSIRNLLPQDAVGRQVRVAQAAAVIAESVAELVILQMLSSLRELHRLDHGLKNGKTWTELRTAFPGRLLGSQVVGLVGASRTGRAVLELLKPFGCEVLVTDPLLSAAEAARLGAELVDLDTLLLRSDVVSLHVPLLPETEGMIGARELALLRDGVLFVNSARGKLVDGDALLAELHSGRIRAALDVFPAEPLPEDSEWRQLAEPILSPHSAGHTIESHRIQGAEMVGEIERLLGGEPLRYEVSAESVAVLA
ncbi:hydroxyacid dehydrogenase [Tenggerimyces flavus]|uniref:Hydroxyacid dehydrogenase n=1 Tax=Tenggerimyces flavus TaxID=1708749 RepID=A0ABV7YAN2_9ACTN|nr:hydroxyacid dehydrogenase [Tenggerimyces flavus]MBM7785163.1 phosphoglycerate dehydrogenase-like enzyme [Tenggerimyces flavus]